jgi:ribosome-associated protein
VLDLRGQAEWTDYFVITTATSATHMKALGRHIREFLDERSVEPLRRRKQVTDDAWHLVDCGDFVVHVMSAESRAFYELERLWYSGTELYHSSKSS